MPSGNHIANVDPDAKSDGPIGRLVTIMVGHLLLHLHGTAHCSIDAVEHDEQGITASLDDPTTMLTYGWIDQRPAESAEPFERPLVVQSDQAAVAHHVGMDDGDQLPPILRSFEMWWSPTSLGKTCFAQALYQPVEFDTVNI